MKEQLDLFPQELEIIELRKRVAELEKELEQAKKETGQRKMEEIVKKLKEHELPYKPYYPSPGVDPWQPFGPHRPFYVGDRVGVPPIYGSSELVSGKLEPVKQPGTGFSDNVGL